MGIATRNPIKKQVLPEVITNQLDEVFNSGKNNDIEYPTEQIQKKESVTEKKAKKRDNTDVVNLYLPKGERANFKIFCAENGIDMTNFIYTCMDFVRSNVEDGKLSVSKAGIKILQQDFLK